ncbi:uncharacterized protein LOC129565179 [Sitodiplosis mosellana]|uniref:uncharacterized protein LOC129565179 n=1 Tax=Sitodiplosis mosellana TaxID=263140 RepID=UPI0024453326|nr:uncharacterized protein LOC129565179 [Sitodiplosis mosellana]
MPKIQNLHFNSYVKCNKMTKIAVFAFIISFFLCRLTESAPAGDNAELEIYTRELELGHLFSVEELISPNGGVIIVVVEEQYYKYAETFVKENLVSKSVSVFLTSTSEYVQTIQEEMTSPNGEYYYYFKQETVRKEKIWVMYFGQ